MAHVLQGTSEALPLPQVEASAAELDKLQKANQNLQNEMSQVSPWWALIRGTDDP